MLLISSKFLHHRILQHIRPHVVDDALQIYID